jgi:hypothetical protein
MQKYYSIPLAFFSIAALLGLFLRWQFVDPTPGVRYTYFLHGHSHMMFLGWVFNVILLASIEQQLNLHKQPKYLKVFLFLQLLTIAMAVSFPVQGYGPLSILLSTAHTFIVILFIPFFFRDIKAVTSTSRWFIRVAWIFFLLSTLGPFALAYLMANGMANTVWYHFSIYYYLHFQYNGFFLFGILSMFFHFLESRNIPYNTRRVKIFGKLAVVACVPAYMLSILYANPPVVFNLIGVAAAIVQLVAFVILIKETLAVGAGLQTNIHPVVAKIGWLIVFALAGKFLLQLASAHPYVAELAYTLRPLIIAYLHLGVVGVITLFLMAWYYQMELVQKTVGNISLALFVSGFAGSEMALLIMPWWNMILSTTLSAATVIFTFSILMAAGGVLFFVGFVQNQKKPTG